MQFNSTFLLLACSFALASPTVALEHTPPQTDEEKIENAMSAAPASVAADATIVEFDADMNMKTLREGSNNFTCMPDNQMSPGNDPMCLDKGGMEWAAAWMSHETPPEGTIGFAYMLMGGSDASNSDPHATEPAAGAQWVDTGPHVMIFNVGAATAEYPRQSDNPDTRQPYVMWADTPYEHLMIPIE